MWASARTLHDAPSVPQRFLDIAAGSPGDTRPILLFDLNGTLTTHTAQKRSAGVNLVRPGVHHLMQLQVGTYTPHSKRCCSMYFQRFCELACRATFREGPRWGLCVSCLAARVLLTYAGGVPAGCVVVCEPEDDQLRPSHAGGGCCPREEQS